MQSGVGLGHRCKILPEIDEFFPNYFRIFLTIS